MEELLEDLYVEGLSVGGRLAAYWLVVRACVDALGRGLRARYGTRRSRRGVGRNESWRPAMAIGVLAQEARFALRTLWASPAVTLVAVVVFALGIGATTTVFSVVEAALLRGLPFAEPDRLVDVTVRPARLFERENPGAGGGLVTMPSYRAWRRRAHDFEVLAVYTSTQPVLTGLGEPEKVRAYPAESTMFGLLGARALVGRGLLPEDDLPGAHRVVVLSYGFWATRLAGDHDALGTSITLDGDSYEIVGVMPRSFRFPIFSDPTHAAMWLPLGLQVEALERGGCFVIGRMREQVTIEQAKFELDDILRSLERSGSLDPSRTGWKASVTPLSSWVVEDVWQPLLVLLGAVGLVLLVACSNVANLLLARGAAREREMSIRMAVGASSRRLMGQVLMESVLLATAGGLLGSLLAYHAVPLVLALGGDQIPRINDVGVNVGVLVTALTGTFLAGIIAGCVPALRVARRSEAASLGAAGAPVGSGRRAGRTTSALVVAQLAMTLMLLAGAGLLLRSLVGLLQVNPGFETTQRLLAQVELPRWLYAEDEDRVAYANQVLDRVGRVPSVADVALSTAAPFESYLISTVTLPDAPALDELPMVEVSATTPDYFRVAGIPILRGRLYDDTARGNVAVLDQTAADIYFPGEDPLGRQLATYRWRDDPLTVIGVVGTVSAQSLRDDPRPHLYVPLSASPGDWLRVLVRTTGEPEPAAQLVHEAIREIDPFVPIKPVIPLRTLIDDSLEQERFYALILGSFAATAILMAGVGVFGVMRYAVSLRTKELGIRVALGAAPADILRMVIGRGLLLSVAGIVVGALGAAATTRLLSSLLYGLSPLDPLTFVTVAALIVGLALGATASPAWRATRIDPVRSLRSE